jgi:hypothetical protein
MYCHRKDLNKPDQPRIRGCPTSTMLAFSFFKNITNKNLAIDCRETDCDIGEVGKRVWHLSLVFDTAPSKILKERKKRERAS